MSLDVVDLDKIRLVIKDSLEPTISFIKGNIERNASDIAKNNEEIRSLETQQSVTEVYVKNLFNRIDWKGWIALAGVLVALATIVGKQ